MVFAIIITPIDFSRIGLVDEGRPDVAKWATRLVAWYLPLALVAPRWGSLLEALKRPPTSWIWLYALYGALSVFWGTAPDQALLSGLGVLGLCTLTTWYVHTAGWRAFATALVFGLTVLLGIGVVFDYYDGILIDGRSEGITLGPTTLARLAAYNMVYAGALIWSKTVGRLAWISVAVSAIVLAFAETRTAMIMAAVGLLYGGLRRLSRLDRVLILSGLGVAAVSFLVLAGSASEDVSDLAERGDPTSFSGRVDIWPVAWNFITERPLFGHGLGAQERLFEQAANQGDLTFLAGTSHSMVLSALLSGGVVGFCLLSIAFTSAFWQRRRVDPWVLSPLIVVLVGGLTEAIVHLPSISTMVIVSSMTAIAMAPRWQPAPVATAPKRRRSLIDS